MKSAQAAKFQKSPPFSLSLSYVKYWMYLPLHDPGRKKVEFDDVIANNCHLDYISNYKYTVHMPDIRFEWDAAKAPENRRKHGVSFEEAQTVFFDENAIRYFDPDHSGDEDRFLMLGMSFRMQVIVVCHCYRVSDSVIRIISARKANRKEQESYWR
ncbi:MAG TPA: BrnT family toxin [Thermodesulfovibrionales bacterium]|nr:BrnT family toxin [Thermodesulfovibrionales bacterium]